MEVSNKYFSSSNVISYIRKYKKENEIVSSKGKNTYIILGILAIVGPILVMLFTGRLFYIVLIGGVVSLIKGISVENGTKK